MPLTTLPAGLGPMANPITTPEPGAQNVPSREAGAAAGTQRDPTGPTGIARPTRYALGITPHDAVALEPVGHPDRPTHAPAGTASPVGAHRGWGSGNNEWNQQNPGTHAEVKPGASSPSGVAEPFATPRNTFRLPPAPWDASLYVGIDTGGS